MDVNVNVRAMALALALAALSLCAAQSAAAQGLSKEQEKRAVERSTNAAHIWEAATGAQGIPRELIDKAQAVAVIPHLVKAKLLFEHLTTGYGVVCSRLPGGWSYPAYYAFGGVGFEFNVAGGESADVIMLFMNKDSAAWFQKGRFELKGAKKGVSGEVGELPKERLDKLGAANLVIYVFNDGKLAGKDYHSNFFNSFVVGPDNKMNKAVYGVKSSETLAGKSPNAKSPAAKSLPQGVTDFQLRLSESTTGSGDER